MPTLTLDLPEAVYQDALTFTPTERVRLVAAALSAARTVGRVTLPLQEESSTERPAPDEPGDAALFAQWTEQDAASTEAQWAEDERIYATIEANGIPRIQL